MRVRGLLLMSCLSLASVVACTSTNPSNLGAGGSQPVATGGETAMGGGVAGGAQTGGNATGGRLGSGGTVTSSGGVAGVAGVGGAASSGGIVAAGGTGTGGTAAAGGATGTGGTGAGGAAGGSATGGNAAGGSAAGGTVATGGSGTVVACDLPAPATSGVAKPSGTAGEVKVLNWAGWKGAVSYTFDDANSSQLSNYAALNGLGVRLTFYLITGSATMSNSLWQQAVKDGHELGNHTQSHLQTASASDIDAATAYIKQHFGVTPYTMAAPYGDASYVPLAKTRFMTNRGVANSLVLPLDNTDPWNLPCFIPATGALAAAFNSQIDSALSGGAWRIVLVHGFTGGTDGAYQPVSIDEFTSGVNYAKGLGGLWIDSMVNVGAYWIGQKTVAAVTPTTSGTDKVYTWKLPTNFPPNKCLRVTVGGGTLKQNAAALPWNDRGYYEIALDAGQLTLSP